MDFYPISLDQIYMTAQTTPLLCELTLPQVMEMLLLLSMQGFVNNEGGYYMLKKPVWKGEKKMQNRIIKVQNVPITISKEEIDDYICITDIAAAKSENARWPKAGGAW